MTTMTPSFLAQPVPGLRRMKARACLALGLAASVGLLPTLPSVAQPSQTAAASGSAAALRARHTALQAELQGSVFKRPLHLASTQAEDALRGEVHAELPHPFANVAPSLQARENWCHILILHLNVKQCRSTPGGGISLNVGKKYDQPLSDTYQVNFGYRVVSRQADHLQIQLDAPEGPLGTRDYRITIEAIPLDEARSFIRMSYSYRYGTAARLAMQAYLSTLGRDKVGFSVVGRQADGQPQYVAGVRGVVERNTMRYYLAIEAYLNARSAPAGQQQARRLTEWYAATERYARQLHEVDEALYLEMKQKEVTRQQQP